MSSVAPVNGDPKATAIGFIAVAIWGTAALCVHVTRDLPPFQVLASGFALGSLLLTGWGLRQSRTFAFLRQPWHYYAAVVALIFVNNAAFVLGLRLAPIVVANLINYLWPLLIVLLSVPVLGRPLRWWHLCGAMMGFGGCIWLISGGQAAGLTHVLSAGDWAGYAWAFIAAVSWAVYSLVLRRVYAGVPTQALGGVFAGVGALCALTLPGGALLGGAFNVPWRWPGGLEWLGIAMIGFGTLGTAYACWDYGARRGDVRVMGAASYLTPLLSTLVLALVGDIDVSGAVWLACGLIIGGAVVGGAREITGVQRLISGKR